MSIPEHPFYNLTHLKWAGLLENNYHKIKDELLNIIDVETDSKIGDNWTNAYPHYVESKTAGVTPWKTYEFIFFGIKHPLHIEKCPATFALLSEIPELITAHFSLLRPHTIVNPHKGYSRMVLRNHLPLIVPKHGDMGIKVKDETASWEEGKLLSFNDSFIHEAWNFSDETRVVLLFDIALPNCGYNAQQICQHKIDQLNDPYLLSIANKNKWQEWLNNGEFSV